MLKNSKKLILALLLACLGLSLTPTAFPCTRCTELENAVNGGPIPEDLRTPKGMLELKMIRLAREIDTLKYDQQERISTQQFLAPKWKYILKKIILGTALAPGILLHAKAQSATEYSLVDRTLMLLPLVAASYICVASYYKAVYGMYCKYKNTQPQIDIIDKEIKKKQAMYDNLGKEWEKLAEADRKHLKPAA
jgi:hypothetical protein